MNSDILKAAEKKFMVDYPGGYDNEQMQAVAKKHRMDKLVALSHESFSKEALLDYETAAENMIKLVTRSTMVSVFEKPKFRDAVRGMDSDEKRFLVNGLNELLHGDEEKGFNILIEVLTPYKLAKWTLLTVFRCYYYPDTDLLYKPTTVKKVIAFFEVDGLEYKPRPSYPFFIQYRDLINKMKKEVSPSLSPSNAAFSGFLMMSMEK